MGGKPCIRGMRVTVEMIVGLVATGYTTAEILKAYPYLELDYDSQGHLVSLEILDASRRVTKPQGIEFEMAR